MFGSLILVHPVKPRSHRGENISTASFSPVPTNLSFPSPSFLPARIDLAALLADDSREPLDEEGGPPLPCAAR
jgi:hypothetical protein